MTQEELDALMAGGLDDELGDDTASVEEAAPEENTAPSKDTKDTAQEDAEYASYRPDSTKAWPPPPPTNDHKVVHQLDDVTRDSEEKATALLEKIEVIMDYFAQNEAAANKLKDLVGENLKVWEILCEKFPNVMSFAAAKDRAAEAIAMLEGELDICMMGQDEAMMAMDAMQYQDIHRQKIERVINVMRALSRYMNSLFEGKIDDERRVSSAVHIEGDDTADVVSNDDIEALIASLGK